MSNKCFIVAAVLLLQLLACPSGCLARSRELSAEKLAKEFEKINAHLDKSVNSDDPQLLMREVKSMLDKKSSATCFSLFGGSSSLISTLELLLELAKPSLDRLHCSPNMRRPYLEKIDTGLVSYPHRPSMNYLSTKVDKLIEYYAFKEAHLCDYNGHSPNMPFAYKRLAYTSINRYLMKVLPGEEDVEKNMVAAEEYLKGLKPRDGAVARAVAQFLTLRSTLSRESCNEAGYEVLLRNDLAVSDKIYNLNNHPDEVDTGALSRVEQCILYYAKRHEEICRPVVRESILAAVQKLDRDTYRKVLALISSHYLDESSYSEVVEKVSQKEVDGDFRLPHVKTELADKMVEEAEQFETKWKIQKLNMDKLYHFIRTLIAADPNFSKQRREELERDEKGGTSGKEIMRLLKENLFLPCENYLKVMEPLMEINQYGRHTSVSYPKAPEDELVKDMTYNIAYDIYRACKYVQENRLSIFYMFANHKFEFP